MADEHFFYSSWWFITKIFWAKFLTIRLKNAQGCNECEKWWLKSRNVKFNNWARSALPFLILTLSYCFLHYENRNFNYSNIKNTLLFELFWDSCIENRTKVRAQKFSIDGPWLEKIQHSSDVLKLSLHKRAARISIELTVGKFAKKIYHCTKERTK